jgi:hypothetical protein
VENKAAPPINSLPKKGRTVIIKIDTLFNEQKMDTRNIKIRLLAGEPTRQMGVAIMRRTISQGVLISFRHRYRMVRLGIYSDASKGIRKYPT